ncbi:hypothetical protein HanXRQr2_Chr12g0538231 [Helianthus annuus]|uniref:Uncharacterized protein n=1 Tax=Helianthus annuus TaxID=4232 RepID=A0A9K3HG34_HELAN|nr:hypothetical protein HanXRQr2_Chr12g0538231 [Helianthus annuus]KAJ0862427.1 hypothetical protein HanPSC8_Chr12g0518051 [Helianthus annuus]
MHVVPNQPLTRNGTVRNATPKIMLCMIIQAVNSISHFLLGPCTTRISQILPSLFKNPKASLNVFS